MSDRMFWKNGIEYRGVEPAGGERTRCEVAFARFCVTASRAKWDEFSQINNTARFGEENMTHLYRYSRRMYLKLEVHQSTPQKDSELANRGAEMLGGATVHHKSYIDI